MNVDAIQKKSYSQENKMWSEMRKHYFQAKKEYYNSSESGFTLSFFTDFYFNIFFQRSWQ